MVTYKNYIHVLNVCIIIKIHNYTHDMQNKRVENKQTTKHFGVNKQ